MVTISIRDDLPLTGEKFTPGMAWIDLQILGKNRPSERSLADRWKWSRDRVRRFLAKVGDVVLQDQQQDHRQDQKVISKSNSCEIFDTTYDTSSNTDNKATYKTTKEKPLNGPSLSPARPSPPGPPITHTPAITPPIIPQENTRVAHACASIDARMQAFRSDVDSFSGEWEREMLDEFFIYWSEPNKSQTKMRYEMEKTWDLSRRLARWDKNHTDKGKPSQRKSLFSQAHNEPAKQKPMFTFVGTPREKG